MDTIFVLNTNKQVIDILSNNGANPSAPFFDDVYTSELVSGAESYEFTTFNNSRTNITLEVGNYILFKYDDKYKLFQITETNDEHSEGKKLLTVYAEMAGMELLNDYCEPFAVEGNFITFMNRVLQDTNWVVGRYSADLVNDIQLIEVKEYENVYSLIQNHLATFGGVEIEFRAEFVGNQLAGLYIDCYSNGARGDKTYRRFEYGEHIKGITRNRNINDLATAVIGEGKDGLTFKDISWSKSLGDPCDKPLQQNFVVDVEANDIWNNNGKYIKTVYKCDATTAEDLLQQSWDYLQDIKNPKFDYDVDLALVSEDYQDLRVGDTNYVLDFDYQPAILLEARVGKLEISFSDPRDNKCTLSNYKELTSILTTNLDMTLVDDMIESKFPIGGDKIMQGAIGEGHIDVTYYQAIKTDIMSATLAEVGTLIADKADITDLNAVNANIENLRANKADITDLNAANANITNLNAQVANIETLIGGQATTGDLTTIHLTAANTTIDNAVIKNAMIDNISAGKINTGTLNTNNVVIQSDDGGIVLSGATQQFKDSSGTVRVQIGRDASDNFTFALFSQDGTGILIDETGIKAGAVPDGLVVDNMVSEGANISGEKLNISSVITQINGNTTMINSSSIQFDDTGQSLLVAFNTLKNKVDTIEDVTIDGDLSSVIEQVTTNTTQIGIMQGQITSLIENTTYTKEDGTVVQLKDEYNATVDTVNSHTTKIGSLETNYDKVSGDLESVISKQSTMEQNLDGFKTTVSETYYTKTEVDEKDATNQEYIDSGLTNIEEALNTNIEGTINDTAEQIMADIEDKYVDKDTYQTYTESVTSSFEQTANDIEMTFTTAQEGIQQVGDSLEEYKNYVSTNIRFSDDGINIGKSDSPFDVNIGNERMSFTENGTEVAYISNQEMLITDANVKNSLRLGYFKFVPRASGNLSLVWDEGDNLLKSGDTYKTYSTQTFTATRDDGYFYTDITAYLTAGVTYKFTCESDGLWVYDYLAENGDVATAGTDTVECFLSDQQDGTQSGTTHVHLKGNNYTFSVPATGTWYLRFDVNLNGATHSFWDFKIIEVVGS